MFLATVSSDTPLAALADHTDKIMDVATLHQCQPSVACARSPVLDNSPLPVSTPSAASFQELAQLRTDMRHLQDLLACALRSSRQGVPILLARSQRRTPTRFHNSCSRSSSPPIFRHAEEHHGVPLCWYHRRSGAATERWTRPCGWQGNH